MGQQLGVPVWKLLGGCFRDRVPAYANGWYQADYEPARIAELARGVVARGYRAMKLDPFGAASVRLSAGDRRRAIAVVAAVREAIGPDIDLMIEMHGRFSPDTAAQVAAALEPYDPRWLEEPVPPESAHGPGSRPARHERVRSRPASGSTRSGTRRRSSRAATSTSSRPT